MAERITIHMLGRFEVIVGEQRIDQRLRKSTKGWTLVKYLLLHMGEEVPFYELYEVLWPNEESTNPENALKTLISRMRAFLSKCSPELGDCIVTNHGAYGWNSEIDCQVDIVEFEGLCRQTEHVEALDAQSREWFDQMLALYVGDLLPGPAQEAWAVSRAVTLHNLYIRSVHRYLDLLKAGTEYADIVRVCRKALEIDPFDERLHIDLMDALVHTKRNNEAMLQYKHAANLHLRYLGLQPPEGIQEFYKHITSAGQMLDQNLEDIRTELNEDDSGRGAFVCEYSVFKEIYHLQMRNLERLGATMFVALLMVSCADGATLPPIKLEEVIGDLLRVMAASLRRGDTVARYNATQYALLLPNVNYDTGRMVMERIKAAFYKTYPDSTIVCTYRLGPVREDA